MKKKRIRIFKNAVALVFILGCLIPQDLTMPVEGAHSADYNKESFWFYPWGKSVTHKGVDIFSDFNTPIHSSTKGVVISTGTNGRGGNFVLVLGPKWRLHYYAHVKEIKTTRFAYVNQNSLISTVGTSGNAKGKSPHLHYSIFTIIPYVWRIDNDKQGWKKMFFLNPIEYLKKS